MPTIKIPDWLKELKPTIKDEKTRALHGLYPKCDGWYKSLDGKTKYICKPMPIARAIERLESRGKIAVARAPIASHAMTLDQLVETFLAKMLERVRGEVGKPMKRQTYDDYVRTLFKFSEVIGGDRLAATIGTEDFSDYMKNLASAAPSTVRREIQYIDRLFNWAGPGKKTMNWIPFALRGPDWSKPSDEDIAVHAADSDKAYSTDQVNGAFAAIKGDPLLNAAGHLGISSAFTPMDIGTLPESYVDLDNAVIRFPRGKNGNSRLCPLLPQTVSALRDYLVARAKFKTPAKPESAGMFFRTREGSAYQRWFGKDEASAGYRDNRMSRRWSKMVGLPFSGLRSTFATVIDDWHDQRAVDVVMGHKVGKVGQHIRKHYAKKFSIERASQLVVAAWTRAFGT